MTHDYKRKFEPLRGAKGGESSSRTPVESPDSLSSIAYARMLDLISEGEIVGLVDGMKSVFLDETPLMNPDGSLNFQKAQIWTTNGTQDQSYMPGFPAVESENGVGVELKFTTPWTRAVNNLQLSAVSVRLSVRGLQKTNTSNGDITGYSVSYAIDVAVVGGGFVQVLSSAFTGKTAAKYERTHRINLPASATGWTLRVRRLTADATTSSIQDATWVESITEIIDAKFRYPNSALVGCQFDSSQFSSIPTRSFRMRGRIIKVPSNYDPATRYYSGVWDGTFKPAWTDNPAWIYYDLLLHPRYGLGNRINAGQVDKWSLYQIARYCDELVEDGQGGMEPRFTCNLYLQDQRDALRVLQDIASVFRGITYWGAGQSIVSADMPSDPVYTYTNANVLKGKFSYKGSAKATRYSTCLVSWNDPADFYRAKVEYLEDRDQVAAFGIQPLSLTAFGCSSQGQAQRAGKWAMVTNKLEAETVSFSVGIDGALARPGQVIRVADNARAGRRIGGRIRAANRLTIVVDSLEFVNPGDKLTIITPQGVAETRTVVEGFCGIGEEGGQMAGSTNYYAGSTEDFAGEFNLTGCVITVDQAFSAAPVPTSIWAIESDELVTQRYRVISVAEAGKLEYSITASKYVVGKYANIDSGTIIEQPPISVIPPSVQPAPTNITVASDYMLDQGQAVNKMTIAWDPAPNAVAYEVQWRRDDSDWIFAGRTGTAQIVVSGIYAGRYLARVMAFNASGVPSLWASGVETQLDGKTTAPPMVTGFAASGVVFGINLSWGFPQGATDTNYTEIQYNTVASEIGAMKLGDFSYPTDSHNMVGLGAGVQFFFRARLVDKTGNIGPWTGWIYGMSSNQADEILDYLTGQITETQLGQDLLEEIDNIAVNSAAIQVTQETVNDLDTGLSAMYSIKLGVNVDGTYYAAGMGIGIENTPGGMQSQVLFVADRFAILNQINGAVTSPFIVQGGVTYMSSAFIQNGTINMLKIGDNLQSDNFVSGLQGWKMGKTGVFENNGISASGGRMVQTPTSIKMYHPNGVLAVNLSS